MSTELVKCRTCLIETKDYKNLEQSFQLDSELVKYSNMLSSCTGLEISEHTKLLGEKICTECEIQIIRSYIFRQKCWNSNEILLKELKQKSNVNSVMQTLKVESVLDNVMKIETDEWLKDDIKDSRVSDAPESETDIKSDVQMENDSDEEDGDVKVEPTKKKRKRIHRKMVCPFCGKKYSNLTAHIRTHTGERPFKCKYCDYTAAHAKTISTHTAGVHGTSRDWICDFPNCDKAYFLKPHLEHHKKKHEDPKFECLLCEKKFYAGHQLKTHQKFLHNPDSFCLPCEFCDKIFARPEQLKRHRLTHTREYTHFCEQCGKGFIRQDYWKVHMKKCHAKVK